MRISKPKAMPIVNDMHFTDARPTPTPTLGSPQASLNLGKTASIFPKQGAPRTVEVPGIRPPSGMMSNRRKQTGQ